MTFNTIFDSKFGDQLTTASNITMSLLETFSKKSRTAAEAADALNTEGVETPGYWKRVADLRNRGLITFRLTPKGELFTVATKSGRKAQVYKITDKGRAQLREHKKALKAATS